LESGVVSESEIALKPAIDHRGSRFLGRRTDLGLARYLDPWTVVVVGDASRQPGLAARLLRKAPCPVVIVPPSA